VHVSRGNDIFSKGLDVWGIKPRKRKRPLNSKLTLGQLNMAITVLGPFVDLLIALVAPTLKHHQWLTHQCWIDVHLINKPTLNQCLVDMYVIMNPMLI